MISTPVLLAVIALIMLGLLLLGFPMKVPLLASALAVLTLSFPEAGGTVLVQQWIGGVRPAALLAVPMFIFAADIMTRGQAADRMLAMVSALVGHLRGGLPITTALGCTLFGAISGSTQATVVAIGGPLRPRLMAAGYSSAFSTALIINASDIALLIPPSIGMIVYGVVSGVSIGELFVAGIGPGLLILTLFCIYCYARSVALDIPRLPRANWSDRRAAIKKATLPLGFPLIIVGGIYSGMFSPTEAAAISVAYALILELLVYRELGPRDIIDIACNAGLVTAVVFVLVGAGAAFSWVIAFAEIPDYLVGEVLGLDAGDGYYTVALAMAAAFFVGCMFVDPIVVILILTPIFHPLAVSAGMDPVLAGVIVTMQVAIGSATPPFGCDIFTAIAVFRRPYTEVIRGTPPFIALLLLSAALVIVFPAIALFLPGLIFD